VLATDPTVVHFCFATSSVLVYTKPFQLKVADFQLLSARSYLFLKNGYNNKTSDWCLLSASYAVFLSHNEFIVKICVQYFCLIVNLPYKYIEDLLRGVQNLHSASYFFFVAFAPIASAGGTPPQTGAKTP
jgi:hypothetical protein